MEQYGLLGEVLGHSLSPWIHGRMFDALGINGEYDLYEVSAGMVGEWMGGQALSLKGFQCHNPLQGDRDPLPE